jgi:hypothetical protein
MTVTFLFAHKKGPKVLKSERKDENDSIYTGNPYETVIFSLLDLFKASYFSFQKVKS